MRLLVRPCVLGVALALTVAAPAGATTATPSVTTSPSSCASGTGSVRVDGPSPRRTVAGDLVTVTTTVTGPLESVVTGLGSSYRWTTPTTRGPAELAAVTPMDVVDVSSGQALTRTWTGRPSTSTRIRHSYGYRTGCLSVDGVSLLDGDGVIDVAPRLTLRADRAGVRDYVFSGTASRPHQVLSLYRTAPGGRAVLTAQTRAAADRTWRITRRFGTSGRFDVVLRTGRDMASAPGASAVRPTVVH